VQRLAVAGDLLAREVDLDGPPVSATRVGAPMPSAAGRVRRSVAAIRASSSSMLNGLVM